MNRKSCVPDKEPEQIFQSKAFIWGIAIVTCGLSFYLPVLTYGTERFNVILEDAIRGCEMVSYRPLLTAFVITFPVLASMLRTSQELSEKSKVRGYFILGLLFTLALAASALLTAIEIYDVEHRIVTFAAGLYFIYIMNFLNLTLGVLDSLIMMDDEEEEELYY